MPSDFSRSQFVRAAKLWRCAECRKVIPVGEMYERTSGNWEGSFFVTRLCADCAALWEYVGRQELWHHPEDAPGYGDLFSALLSDWNWITEGSGGEYIPDAQTPESKAIMLHADAPRVRLKPEFWSAQLIQYRPAT